MSPRSLRRIDALEVKRLITRCTTQTPNFTVYSA